MARSGWRVLPLALLTATGCSSGGAHPVAPMTMSDSPDAQPAASDAAPDAEAMVPCPRTSAEIVVANAFGDLHGTLQTPDGCGPFPVVVIIPGSGAVDRDGNSLAAGLDSDTYRLLAAGFADAGIASVRYDKGGIGGSRGAAPLREADLRFEMGADDVARWVAMLRSDRRFGHVVLAGHSEGSLLGMLAAEQVAIDGFVSLEGAGRPIAVILREQLAQSLHDAALLASANSVIDALEQGQTVATVPPTLSSLFRPSVQPYLISWMKYDPTKEIQRVVTRALIVQGTTDVQVKVDDARLLGAARPDAAVVVIDGMNHALKAATLDAASQNRAYTDPTLPLVRGVLDAAGAFVVRDD